MSDCQYVIKLSGNKHTMQEDLKDSDFSCKKVKKWNSWDDLEGLMRSRIPITNCRWKDKGPSNFNPKV